MRRPDWSTIRAMHGVQHSWLWEWGLVGHAKVSRVKLVNVNAPVPSDLLTKVMMMMVMIHSLIRTFKIAYQRGKLGLRHNRLVRSSN